MHNYLKQCKIKHRTCTSEISAWSRFREKRLPFSIKRNIMQINQTRHPNNYKYSRRK